MAKAVAAAGGVTWARRGLADVGAKDASKNTILYSLSILNSLIPQCPGGVPPPEERGLELMESLFTILRAFPTEQDASMRADGIICITRIVRSSGLVCRPADTLL